MDMSEQGPKPLALEQRESRLCWLPGELENHPLAASCAVAPAPCQQTLIPASELKTQTEAL